MTQSNCSRLACLMIPLMFSNNFMKHKCSLFKAEDDNIFLLPTDLMYKTDPELRAIAEVFVFEKTVLHLCISMCFFTQTLVEDWWICFCICIIFCRTMRPIRQGSWWTLQLPGINWPLQIGAGDIILISFINDNFNDKLFSGTMDLWAIYAINNQKKPPVLPARNYLCYTIKIK